MVELWFHESGREYLACVLHQDCFDYGMCEELVDFSEVEINLTIKGDKV